MGSNEKRIGERGKKGRKRERMERGKERNKEMERKKIKTAAIPAT